MSLDPVRSPVDGTLREALEVALAYQRYAAATHETWPVGVAWDVGGRRGFVQWGHDTAAEDVPGGYLGLLEAGVATDDAERFDPALTELGFDADADTYGQTRVRTWAAEQRTDDDPDSGRVRRLDGVVLLDLLERVALAAGAPARAAFELFPDA